MLLNLAAAPLEVNPIYAPKSVVVRSVRHSFEFSGDIKTQNGTTIRPSTSIDTPYGPIYETRLPLQGVNSTQGPIYDCTCGTHDIHNASTLKGIRFKITIAWAEVRSIVTIQWDIAAVRLIVYGLDPNDREDLPSAGLTPDSPLTAYQRILNEP